MGWIIGYPSSSMDAICILSLLSRKLSTSVSVTGLGIFGIACMSFNVWTRSSFNINILILWTYLRLQIRLINGFDYQITTYSSLLEISQVIYTLMIFKGDVLQTRRYHLGQVLYHILLEQS